MKPFLLAVACLTLPLASCSKENEPKKTRAQFDAEITVAKADYERENESWKHSAKLVDESHSASFKIMAEESFKRSSERLAKAAENLEAIKAAKAKQYPR